MLVVAKLCFIVPASRQSDGVTVLSCVRLSVVLVDSKQADHPVS